MQSKPVSSDRTDKDAVAHSIADDECRSLSLHVVRESTEFANLSQEWDDLLGGSQRYSFFSRHFWNFSWWQFYAPADSQLWILCCRNAQRELVGIAPLYLRKVPVLGIPCMRELLFIGMGIELKTSEWVDIVVRAGEENRVTRAMAAFIRNVDEWDRISLAQTPQDSEVMPHLVHALGDIACSVPGDQAPYIDTSRGWEHYKSTLGRSMRRNVEYYARRLFKKYECQFRRIESEDELEAAMRTMSRLHQARWHASGSTGAFGHPNLEAFLLQVSKRHFRDGRIRMWVLSISGKTEAALLGFVDNGVLHYFQKGFNPAYSSDDLGTALLSLCIRDCCDDPAIRVFDFMGGGAPYKEMWARARRDLRSHLLARPNARTHLHACVERAWNWFIETLRNLTPLRIRAARRDLLVKRRVNRQMEQSRAKWMGLAMITPYTLGDLCNVTNMLATVVC